MKVVIWQSLMRLYRKVINQAQTYDPQTVTLNVTYEENSDGDHVYSINESDMEKLDSIATHMN